MSGTPGYSCKVTLNAVELRPLTEIRYPSRSELSAERDATAPLDPARLQAIREAAEKANRFFPEHAVLLNLADAIPDLLAALDAERAEVERLTRAHAEEVARNQPLRNLIALLDKRLANGCALHPSGSELDRRVEHEKQMADMRAALTVAEDEVERLRAAAARLWESDHHGPDPERHDTEDGSLAPMSQRFCHSNPYRPSGPRNT